MNKIICIGFLVVLLCVGSVLGFYQSLPRGSCSWIRPATQYRPERVFVDGGVWVRNSLGVVFCSPTGNNRHGLVVSAPIPVPICTPVSVCHNETKRVCGWEKVDFCVWNHGHRDCDKVWSWKCHNESKQVCDLSGCTV